MASFCHAWTGHRQSKPPPDPNCVVARSPDLPVASAFRNMVEPTAVTCGALAGQEGQTLPGIGQIVPPLPLSPEDTRMLTPRAAALAKSSSMSIVISVLHPSFLSALTLPWMP